MKPAFQPYFQFLNSFFDHIYVITIPRAIERQENIRHRLDGLNFEFFYGVDKQENSLEQLQSDGLYNEGKARLYHRYSKALTHGEVACALSHKNLWQLIAENKYNKVLIFEDDVVPDEKTLPFIPQVLNELPKDWELMYLGYDKNEKRLKGKQRFYQVLSALKLLKWNQIMVKNLYPKRISKHISISGFHDMTHAFAVTYKGAEKLLKLQTPVSFTADNALSYAVKNELIRAYICHPKIFHQEMTVNPETYRSLIHQ
jgi:glycosyl transferase, family 25